MGKIALCAIGRLENEYAVEWVEHYLKLGFDHIYIYDNNHKGEEHFEEVLQDYIDKGVVSIVDWRDRATAENQPEAYNDFYQKHPEYEWIAYFDFDEFLVIPEGEDIHSFMERYKGFDCLLVNWMTYGDNGQLDTDGRPIQERLTKPVLPYDFRTGKKSQPQNNQVKSIIRSGISGCEYHDAHVPMSVTLKCCQPNGKPCTQLKRIPFDHSVAYLKHYRTKTIGEWMRGKWQKGAAGVSYNTFVRRYKNFFFKVNERTKEKEDFIRNFTTGKIDRKIIVTLTSWPPRMHYLHNVLANLYDQYLPADEVVLHLSEDEFPNREKDLPDNVMCYVRERGLLLRWHEQNERNFKKLIYTLREWPEDIVVSVDDDMPYPKDFLSRLVGDFIKDGCKRPLSCGHGVWKNWGGIASHWGAFSVTMSKFYGHYLDDLYDNVVKDIVLKNETKAYDDELYTLTALANGIFYGHGGDNLIPEWKKYREGGNICSVSKISGNAGHMEAFRKWRNMLRGFIQERYGIDVKAVAQNRNTVFSTGEGYDLLYLLGSGSKHDNVELRYSLRSIEKYCTGYNRIFVVGQKPEWLTNVIHVPCDDPYGCSHKNMMLKILHACKKTDISEDFVMQADDHFYVKPYDFREIKPYDRGELPTCLREPERARTYRQSLIDTRNFLIQNGYPYMNGSQHCGMWFKKSLFLSVEESILKPAFKFPYGLESSSIMINVMNAQLGIPFEHRDDRKIKKFDGEEHLKERIDDNFCFSIYDGAFDYGIEKILQKWFPEKSRYEK